MEILKSKDIIDASTALVYGVFDNEQAIKINDKIDAMLQELDQDKLIDKKLGAVNKIYTFGKIENKLIYLIGLGKETEYTINSLEKVAKEIAKKTGEKITLFVESFIGGLCSKKAVSKMVLTLNDYQYSYDECKSKKDEKVYEVCFHSEKDYSQVIEEAYAVANAVNNTRDLVNKPYNYLNAAKLAEAAKELVEGLQSDKVKIKVYEKAEIEALEMGAFLGVNKGSKDDPKLIHITYQGKDTFEDPIALVGKGVMYDTGGYSIKQSMNNMKNDMAGSATVLGALQAVVANKLPVNLQIIICATDNRISGDAYLPDDVLTAMNKKTIEIVSTDAEGRLTLADALTFAQRNNSKKIIDLATLTGACVVALGEYTTGLFSNSKQMTEAFLEASKKTNEHTWEMPITDQIRDKVRGSKVADLTNSTGRYMGASGAAAFLEEFVEEGTEWIHLDIAGTAFLTAPSYGEFYGATGVMVKTLYEYLKQQ